ncbi:MAG: hypothetical protein QXF12_08300, partial [Candidatus Aenigmatarchaeota archaeon]
IIILISMLLITLSIQYIKPIIQRSTDNFALNEGLSNLNIIKNAVEQVSSESPGSTRSVKLRSLYGFYSVDGISNTINFTYIKNSDIVFYGSRNGINITTEGNLIRLYASFDNIDIGDTLYFTKGENTLKISYHSFDDGMVKINITT